MFPFACEAGIDAREYWFYTIEEINMTLKGYQKRLATRATMDYRMIELIGPSVGRLMSKNTKFPSFEDAYPNFNIGRPQNNNEEELKIAKTKNWLLTYANAHNAKRRGMNNE